MSDLAILTPSRGRPAQAANLIDDVRQMSHLNTRVLLGVDFNDPDIQSYKDMIGPRQDGHDHSPVMFEGPAADLVQWTNVLANRALSAPVPPRYLASLGDDHLPRTPGWDAVLIDAIERRGGTGIAYGKDLFHNELLPTAWVVSVDIVRALGWMMLPALRHLYVDNVIKDIGEEAGCLVYVPEVIVEHLHPMAGKARWDSGTYRRTNSRAQYAEDGAMYARWHADHREADAGKIRALMGERP